MRKKSEYTKRRLPSWKRNAMKENKLSVGPRSSGRRN